MCTTCGCASGERKIEGDDDDDEVDAEFGEVEDADVVAARVKEGQTSALFGPDTTASKKKTKKAVAVLEADDDDDAEDDDVATSNELAVSDDDDVAATSDEVEMGDDDDSAPLATLADESVDSPKYPAMMSLIISSAVASVGCSASTCVTRSVSSRIVAVGAVIGATSIVGCQLV